MKKILNKKLAQKGGMMIEALAMLGLIAVVTPTMYKKSAERTLEVEDINTATNMRSVMSAADSYVSSNYSDLIHSMTEDGQTEKTIEMDDLRQYLPYGFDANKLYDYNTPKVSVVRTGDNLTSFVLFPAKESGEDGLGQERTVRIATLVGANGGYVNGSKTAKGIGGVWSLNQTNFERVFNDEDPNVYSIVTASSDAINSTNIAVDSDKFLYRTDMDGKWHNTMRADLFLGGFGNEQADEYIRGENRNFSIRNVKRLIIGANSVIDGADPSNQDEIDNSENGNRYGLYIKSSNGIDSAFIEGSLEAAVGDNDLPNFVVNQDSIKGANVNGVHEFEITNTDSTEGENTTPGRLRYGFGGDDRFVVTRYGDISNVGNVNLANDKVNWGGVSIGRLSNNSMLISGTQDGDGEGGELSFMNDDTMLIKDPQGYMEDDDLIVMMNGGFKGDGENELKEISYNNSPTFPIRVGSNAKVEGILSAAQIDAQKLRLATLEAGSENIDDKYKWLKVDEKGIHGSHLKDDDTEQLFSKASVFDVHDTFLALAVGDESLQNGLNFSGDADADGNRNIIFMSSGLGGNAADNYPGINIASTNEINLKTNVIQEQLKNNEIVISSLQGNGEAKTTAVKLNRTNFQVETENNKPVFSVKANSNGTPENDTSGLDYYTRGSNPVADVAVHGNALFTSSMSDESNFRKYMYMGRKLDDGHGAVVNIGQVDNEIVKKGEDDGSVLTIGKIDDKAAVNIAKGENNSTEGIDNVMFVDVGANSTGRRPVNAVKDEGVWKIAEKKYNPGVVYVRKGGVEIMPDKLVEGEAEALTSQGTVAANRFVANNLKSDGTKVEVPKFFKDTEYKNYNGVTDTNGRYDTYMVNPAYTSVMHDIKLTTRGGARLSDILPDFINKGIYITSNTYKDQIKSLKFAMDSGGIKLATGSGTMDSTTAQITLGDENSWASPYLGFVPAPQCPPGYNRLITLAPQSFMMSQAGQMQKGTHGRGGNAYYTKNQVPEESAFDDNNSGAYVQQAFVEARGVNNVDIVDTNGNNVGAVVVEGGNLKTIKAKTEDMNIVGSNNSGQTATYFLASFGDTTPPLTIQQSTWLKTNVIPVGSKNQSYAIDTNRDSDDYVKGWAAIMGFVYDAATYSSVIHKLENQHNNLLIYDGSEGSVYWNIFPVRRNTLEAYATTYCYFDRNGIMWDDLKDKHGDVIDHYNAIRDYKNYTEKKNSSEAYKKRLNDPALKYDEVW